MEISKVNPMTISVILDKERFQPLIGIKETLARLRVWNEDVQEITDEATGKNPYVYFLDECLQKAFNLKYKLERMNVEMLIPVPILCIAIHKMAELSKEYMSELFGNTRGSIGLYFSEPAVRYFDFLSYKHNELSLIKLPDGSCILDKRVYKMVVDDKTDCVYVMDGIVCFMKFSSLTELQNFKDSLLSVREKPFISKVEGRSDCLIVVWNILPFKLLYKSSASCYITRHSELLLEPSKNNYYKLHFLSKDYISLLLEHNQESIFVHPLAIPHCQEIDRYDGSYEGYGIFRHYDRSKETFTPCDASCVLERLARVEKAVNITDFITPPPINKETN